MLSKPGDIVLDPFSGRGTTLLECRLLSRVPVASDINPIAIALSRAKNADVSKSVVFERIAEFEGQFDKALYLPQAHAESQEIQLIFPPLTLAQLCFLKKRLVRSSLPADQFLLGVLLGIMHGKERKDGTSMYASISMPNTFSMSPNYVRKFVQANRLNRSDRNVFELLRYKTERLFSGEPVGGHPGWFFPADAKKIATDSRFTDLHGKVKLVLTSPPYLDVVNYAKQNWIRDWLVNEIDGGNLVKQIDDDLNLSQWNSFIDSVIDQLVPLMRSDGVIVMVIGDVALKSGYISLAINLIRHLHYRGVFRYIGVIDDFMGHEIKTTRIWKATKGKATEIDRLIVLSNVEPEFDCSDLSTLLGITSPTDFRITSQEISEYASYLARLPESVKS